MVIAASCAAVLVALALAVAGGVDRAEAQTLPCKPGIYNCPPGPGEPPTTTTPTTAPGGQGQGPQRGSLATTGTAVALLLGLALLLLVTGRFLVWLAHRHRRHRAARRLAVWSRRGRAPRTPLPGAWTLAR